MNGCRRGVLNKFAPGARGGTGERDRDGDDSREDDCDLTESSPGTGDAGILVLEAVWNGMSVGEMYLRAVDGPGPGAGIVPSESSSRGVIGGGGVSGGVGDPMGVADRGEEARGVVVDSALRALRER